MLVGLLGTQIGEEAEAAAVRCKKSSCRASCDNAVDPEGFPCNCADTSGGDPECVVPRCNKGCNSNANWPNGFVCSQTPAKGCDTPTNKKGRRVQKCKKGTPENVTSAAAESWWLAAAD